MVGHDLVALPSAVSASVSMFSVEKAQKILNTKPLIEYGKGRERESEKHINRQNERDRERHTYIKRKTDKAIHTHRQSK